jgi:hypothetical protein
MHDGARPVRGQQAVDQGAVADVALDEDVAGIALERREVLGIARVGQRVEIDDGLVGLRSQSSTKLLPMKPAPPVTRMVMTQARP